MGDEIAPEYDVVVLGTGATEPRMEGQQTANMNRFDGMYPVWVCWRIYGT